MFCSTVMCKEKRTFSYGLCSGTNSNAAFADKPDVWCVIKRRLSLCLANYIKTLPPNQ